MEYHVLFNDVTHEHAIFAVCAERGYVISSEQYQMEVMTHTVNILMRGQPHQLPGRCSKN